VGGNEEVAWFSLKHETLNIMIPSHKLALVHCWRTRRTVTHTYAHRDTHTHTVTHTRIVCMRHSRVTETWGPQREFLFIYKMLRCVVVCQATRRLLNPNKAQDFKPPAFRERESVFIGTQFSSIYTVDSPEAVSCACSYTSVCVCVRM
jgi:hypothetical protein